MVTNNDETDDDKDEDDDDDGDGDVVDDDEAIDSSNTFCLVLQKSWATMMNNAWWSNCVIESPAWLASATD